jgi:hypothetical protein
MTHHAAWLQVYMVVPISSPMGPTAANFGLTESSEPKTDYIYIFPHWLFCDEAAEKQTIHNIDLKTIMIGVETLPEPLLVAPSPPLTSSPSSP